MAKQEVTVAVGLLRYSTVPAKAVPGTVPVESRLGMIGLLTDRHANTVSVRPDYVRVPGTLPSPPAPSNAPLTTSPNSSKNSKT
jgi:hypothetical protein